MADLRVTDTTGIATEPRSIPLATFGEKPQKTLQNAARDNREDIVRQWLSKLPKYNKPRILDKKDTKGYSAMLYAAKFNRFKIMTLLVTSGASTELASDDDSKLTPLHLSARYLPRYQDEDAQTQDQEEVEVTALSSSKQAMKFLVTFCRVDVNVRAQYGISPLHLACQRGNIGAVEILLANENIDITIADDNKDTPLHEAALNGFTEIVEMILRKMKSDGTISLMLLNDEDQTPLHLACREDHIEIVKLILTYGFEQRRELASAQDNELSTPLHLACESGNDEIVRLLLLNGADLLTPKNENVFPIHIAAKFGFVKVVETMLDSGTDIIDAGDIYQRTPLHYAAYFNQEKMINFLIDKGAEIEASDTSSYTPLMSAAHNGQVLALKTLRHRGAAIDVLDANGRSCVFLAAQANHVPVLRAVMRDRTGAKLALTPDSNYSTPLHIAASKGHLASLRVLLENSQNLTKLDSINELGRTALHLAASNGHAHVVRDIIAKRPNTVLDEDEDGNTALHLACIYGYPNVVKALIGAKADIEARNATLWTPMDCAAARGHPAVVSILLMAGAEVDPTDKLKVTPLQLAAQEGHPIVVNVLLENNANAGQTDQNGFNALDHAIQNGHDDIALAIVRSSQWAQALRNTTDSPFGGTTTPLRKLIRKMPDVAEEVFNRCTSTNASKDGKVRPDSLEYCITFNYEFLEDFREAETRTAKLRRNLRKTFRNDLSDTGSDGMSDVPEAKVKGQTTTLNRNLEDFRLFGRKRDSSNNWGPEGFTKFNHPLSIMVQSETTDLLTHPLVTSLLEHKWRKFGLGFYTFNLVTYIIFLIALTSFALLVPNPLTENCIQCSNATLRDERGLTFQTITFITGPTVTSNPNLLNYIYATGIITIVIAILSLLKEGYQVIQFKLRYITVYNMVEVVLYISALVLAFAIVRESECLCPHRIQYQFGAVAVFLAWINFVLYFRKLAYTGIYVIMFENILITFGKTILLTSLLVLAFGFAFFMAFYNPEADSSRASFSTPLRALFKTATMTIGELEYDSLFRQDPGGLKPGDGLQEEIEFEALARVLWLIFLIFMPIILINLLVGLAVDDIKGIQEAASLKRLELQVELVLDIEEKLPPMRRWFHIGEAVAHPNQTNVVTKFLQSESQQVDKIQNALTPHLEPIEQVQHQTRTLVTDMTKMRETLTDLAERNIVLERIIKQMANRQGINADDMEIDQDGDEEDASISQI